MECNSKFPENKQSAGKNTQKGYPVAIAIA
jgi:hypothetical protein